VETACPASETFPSASMLTCKVVGLCSTGALEALIMTAAGLAVALPAVFAYNAFTRANRVIMADLDAFAHDLHAFFTVGKPFVANSAQIHPMRARAAAGAV